MWNLLRKKEEAAAVAVAEPPVPTPPPVRVKRIVPVPQATIEMKPVVEDAEWAEYMAVATDIGVEASPAVLEERLRRVLREENIHCFKEEKVVAFLNHKLGAGQWEWSGVRKKDVKHLAGWHNTVNGQRVNFGRKQYPLPIPLPVLLTMQKILKACPEVYFYVSAQIPAREGDPFLMVAGRAIESYIVERWDEPDFRER
jgi:hypothetical protein